MTKIIIYTGLSLSFDEAREILDTTEDVEVIYKRPIKRGDLNHDIKESRYYWNNRRSISSKFCCRSQRNTECY